MIYAFLVLIALAEVVVIYMLGLRLMKANDKIDDLNDVIDESLTMLENSYVNIARASKTPVLSDEPFVKKLMSDISAAKDAVVLVMNKMGTFDQEEALDEVDQG